MGRSGKDLQKITKIYVYCHTSNIKFEMDGYDTPVTLTRNFDKKNKNISRQDLKRGRQRW